MNKVMIIGRLTADPECQKTGRGKDAKTYVHFNVACENRFKEEVDFIPCVAWNNTAEFIEHYFEKGKPICITGSIETGNYKDKDGNNRTGWNVHIDTVDFVPTWNKDQKRK